MCARSARRDVSDRVRSLLRWTTRGARRGALGGQWPTPRRANRHDGAVSTGQKRIVIAAGGTAGHVVPALAVADALRAEGAAVTFIGGTRAEAQLVPAAGYPFKAISVE